MSTPDANAERDSLRNEQAGLPVDIRTALKLGMAQLRDAKISSHTLAAELLLLHATGRTRTSLYSHPEDQLTTSESKQYFALIDRRAAGVPVQHLTGKQEFWGLEFAVSPDVLIPRPETEHVIEVALDRLALRDLRCKGEQNMSGEGLIIADVGTGSGCIAIALAKELPAARIYALDISSAALGVARRNADRLAAVIPELADRVSFLESDLLRTLSTERARHAVPLQGDTSESAVEGGTSTGGTSAGGTFVGGTSAGGTFVSGTFAGGPSAGGTPTGGTCVEGTLAGGTGEILFDLIVSNPPYVGRREIESLEREVRDHEPGVALFGGEEGYEIYASLIAQSAAHLKPGGVLVLELGHNSLPAVQPLLETPDWTNVGVSNDLAGIPRVIAAEKL
jgi:HemK-like putative methylase